MRICRPVLRQRIAALLVCVGLGLIHVPALAQAPEDFVSRARQAAAANNNREAARLFEQALSLAPERRNELLLEYADQLAYAGRPADAVPLYQERLAGNLDEPARHRAERGLAFALLWSSRFDQAIAAWQAITSANAGDVQARNALVEATVGAARAAAGRGANQEAAALFERALALDPAKRGEIGREYADQLAYAGKPAQAIPVYRDMLARPNLAADERQRTTRNLAFALLWSSQFQEAIATWEPLVRANPGDTEAVKALSDALVGSARQEAERSRSDQAVSVFKRAIDTAPQRRQELLPEYADQTAYAGHPAQAVPLYREALRDTGQPPERQQRLKRGLAFALLWSGQFREAITAFEEAARQAPDDAQIRQGLADARAGVSRRPAASGLSAQSSPAAPQTATPADAALAAARQAASRGANKEAASLFERAFTLDPSKRSELAKEYADQLAYAGEPARAVPLYRDILARRDLPADQRRPTERALAFALLWSSQFREAIPALQTIVKNDPRDDQARKGLSDALIGAARETAGRGRNAEAVALFERAFSVTPQRRRELLREYAEQVLYAGRPLKAIPLFQEVLRRGDLTPREQRDASLGLARALAWSGQQKAAIPVFTDILQAWPQDVDALIGRGNALNDITDHKPALVDFEAVLALQPRNADALRGAATAERSMGLPRAALNRLAPLLEGPSPDASTLFIAAQSRQEMGRPDLSQDLAQRVLARKPGDAAAQGLLDWIALEQRPLTRVDAWYARRSDDLSISALEARHELTFNNGLTKFGPQARILRYQGGEFSSVDMAGIGFAGRHRFNDVFELRSSFFLNLEDEEWRFFRGRGDDQDVEITHETTLSLIPSDMLRFDLNLARRYADENTRSIINDILADDVGLALDVTPDNATRFSARGLFSRYSDDNERAWGQIEVAKRFTAEPYLWLGARYTAFDFAEVFDNGYWNPDRYQSLEASLHFHGRFAERWLYDIQGAAGYGWSEPGDGGFVSSATARLTYELNQEVSLALYGSHLLSYARSSDDNLIVPDEDDDPFSRWSLGAQLQIRW